MKKFIDNHHKLICYFIGTFIILNILFSSHVLTNNEFNFVFSKQNLIVSILISIIIFVPLCALIFYKEENFFNYVFLFIAPASVSFVVGYPIFDELLFFIILLVLFIKNINKHKFSLNLKENKIYILLYTIFILYSIYGLLVLGNI